jgi:hypothetical protein
MLQLLSQIPIDRALLVVFLAGQLWAQFKSTRLSLRDQGRRIGGLVEKLGALEARVAALEASGKRG